MERMKNPVSKVENARRTRGSVQDVKVDEDEPVNEPIDDSLLHASNSDIAIKSFNSSGFCFAFMTLSCLTYFAENQQSALANENAEIRGIRGMSYEDVFASHKAVLSDETLINGALLVSVDM